MQIMYSPHLNLPMSTGQPKIISQVLTTGTGTEVTSHIDKDSVKLDIFNRSSLEK